MVRLMTLPPEAPICAVIREMDERAAQKQQVAELEATLAMVTR